MPYYDEFVIYKGEAVYTANFTPPVAATSLPTEGVTHCPPFGDQRSYFEITHADLVAGGFAVHSGDFTIEARFRIDKLYKMPTDGPWPRYAICGQYDDTLWAGDVNAAPGNWWALEFHEDEFLFRVWDAGTATYVANIKGAITMSWAAAWSETCNDKLNEDPAYVHVAVSRYGDNIRLFVNGVCDVTYGRAAVVDWDEIHKALEINGQNGRLNPDIPHSITYVEELLHHNYAKYWDDFDPGKVLFSQTGGICIFPRLFPQLIKGLPGDIYEGKLGILLRMHGRMIKGLVGDIYEGKLGIPLRVHGGIVREHIHFPITAEDSFVIADGAYLFGNARYALRTNTNQGIT
jgi:hypothetical protein